MSTRKPATSNPPRKSAAQRLIIPGLLFALFVGLGMFSQDLISRFGVEAIEQGRQVLSYVVQVGIWLASALLINRLLTVFFWEMVVERAAGGPIPRLIKQMGGAVIMLIAVSGIVSFVFGFDITALWATSGALGIVIGFALRPMILDVASGVAVGIDRPYALGDWIQLHQRQPDLFIVGPLTMVVGSVQVVANANNAVRNISMLESVLDKAQKEASDRDNGGDDPITTFETIELSNLEFSYRDSEGEPAFKVGPLDLTIRNGETLFVVGGNGSGNKRLGVLTDSGVWQSSKGHSENGKLRQEMVRAKRSMARSLNWQRRVATGLLNAPGNWREENFVFLKTPQERRRVRLASRPLPAPTSGRREGTSACFSLASSSLPPPSQSDGSGSETLCPVSVVDLFGIMVIIATILRALSILEIAGMRDRKLDDGDLAVGAVITEPASELTLNSVFALVIRLGLAGVRKTKFFSNVRFHRIKLHRNLGVDSEHLAVRDGVQVRTTGYER